MALQYPKRLIEVDLPIARISAHARREKSIRHGHISTLHIWWARRPLAACRAVICAALWPDPADELCPQAFRDAAAENLLAFARRVYPPRLTSESKQLQASASAESLGRWESLAQSDIELDATDPDHQNVLRLALLDFIADFANWDNSTVPAYLETSRALTQAAHEALGGVPGTRPLVVDPFAGGGSIPLEALRVGADAFASDLNPVAVLLNKVVLEYIPKYGQRLADEVRKWGQWVKEQAEQELAEFYPKDPDGATPIAYLWARTIKCEGPGCGIHFPLIRSLWLAKKGKKQVALRLVANNDARRVDFEVIEDATHQNIQSGTVKLGSATCPFCGYTTPVASVRSQISQHNGGAATSQLVCVVTTRPSVSGRFYRSPQEHDYGGIDRARNEYEQIVDTTVDGLSVIPDEPPPVDGTGSKGGGYRTRKYGILRFGDFFSPRQAVSLTTLVRLVRLAAKNAKSELGDAAFADAVQSCLALGVSRHVDMNASLAMWHTTRELVTHVFGRQALPIVWDFAEVTTVGEAGGSFGSGLEWIRRVIENNADLSSGGTVDRCSAATHFLPDDSAQAFITDPPYYDAVPYADLSDFFYVWLKRMLPAATFNTPNPLTPKEAECVVDIQRGQHREHFEKTMQQAMAEGRRTLQPDGVGVLVFAHKSTIGWETQLQAIVNAGWVISGSWPIDTEMETRLRARNSAALASSVHLVCRPRENSDGSLREEVGEWRDVLSELPQRIHEWMPRLAAEGIVGADAIFACLGPALEIFSRYSRVEKASGEAVALREYLEQVWAAVSTEALSMIFEEADAAGLEPDARLTAMWLWTLGGGMPDTNGDDDEEGSEDEDKPKVAKGASSGFTLEFDAARKIAQGLGIHLEQSESIVEVKGDKARLLPVSERTRHLFGKAEASAAAPRGRSKKKVTQRSLFAELEELEAEAESVVAGELKPQAGETVLDRVHQAMILFASGRGEALRRFLVDDGAGTDARFWKLAQSLSALYPKETDEKRWVDGVLARKKGIGL